MARERPALETEFEGTVYRSRTEARWAVFFRALDLTFSYEPETIELSSGEYYLPDFYVEDFGAYFEVKPSNDEIVTEECVKTRSLAEDRNGQPVWLAIGPPSSETPNILPLNHWPLEVDIAEILSTSENRYYFLEDRRDDKVYWLQADQISGGFLHTYMVGGPGTSTDHDRPPLLRPNISAAYEAAKNPFRD